MKSALAEQSFDEPLDALAHIRRRKLLRPLMSQNLRDDDPGIIDADESGDVGCEGRLEMEHVHLSNQERDRLLDWHQDSNQVPKRSNFEAIRPLLEMLVTCEEDQ